MPAPTATAEPSTQPPSERRLTEVARHVVVPTGIVDTLWFEVEDQCREWGDEFDTWQDGLGQLALGLRSDGYFAATVGGITLSIPRQVAKTFIVGRIVFALCARYPNLTVLWTAHRIRTASQTFDKLKGLADRPSVRAYLAQDRSGGIRNVNGEQEFRFANGSRILFGAREQGFGRGFDEVDIEVFDEAQILTEKALEDMVAATNQSRFPHGALLFYMGTPPRPVDPGDEFAERRTEALAIKPGDQVYAECGDAMYVECSADPKVGQPNGPSLDDPEQVAIANPSYPHRTPPVSIQRLRKNLRSPGSWRREGLGVWDEFEQSQRVLGADDWKSGALIPDAIPTAGVKSFAVRFAPDGSRVAVAGAMNPGGDAPIHVELVGAHSGSMAAGTRMLAEWLVARWQETAQIVVDGMSHAGAFVNALRDAGVSERVIWTPTFPDVATANAMLVQAVTDGRLTHLGTEGQIALDESALGSTKKVHGDKGAWSWRPIGDADELPIQAASLAHWAAKTTKRRPGQKGTTGGRTSGGRASGGRVTSRR